MAQQDRLRWRCRRGTRELDLLLLRYLDDLYHHATTEEQGAFECLLKYPDPELQHLLLGEGTDAKPDIQALVERIRGVSES